MKRISDRNSRKMWDGTMLSATLNDRLCNMLKNEFMQINSMYVHACVLILNDNFAMYRNAAVIFIYPYTNLVTTIKPLHVPHISIDTEKSTKLTIQLKLNLSSNFFLSFFFKRTQQQQPIFFSINLNICVHCCCVNSHKMSINFQQMYQLNFGFFQNILFIDHFS